MELACRVSAGLVVGLGFGGVVAVRGVCVWRGGGGGDMCVYAGIEQI